MSEWKEHNGKCVPDEVIHRIVEVQYSNGSKEEFYVDPDTWVGYGSAWQWGTWSTRIVRYRFRDMPQFLKVDKKEEEEA